MSNESRESRRAVSGAYLPRADRLSVLLGATAELINENGIADVSLTAIANRVGVTRQWLYEFFPDLDTIFASLYQSARTEYIKAFVVPPTDPTQRAEFLKAMLDSYLEMPVACAIVGIYAINGGLRNTTSAQKLKDSILGNLEKVWIDPMVKSGESRDEAYASVIVFMNCLFGLIIAMNDGLTTKARAKRRLEHVIDVVASVRDTD